MGFQFFPIRKGDNQQHCRGIKGTKSADTDDNNAGPRRQIMKTVRSVKSKYLHQGPVTPTASTRPPTPATTLIERDENTANKNNATDGFEIHYRDTITVEMLERQTLEEQERIRQQLFDESEGIEVTAQFRQLPNPHRQQHQLRKQKLKQVPNSHDEEEELEEKSENVAPLTPQSPEPSCNKTNNKKKQRSKSSSKGSKSKPPPAVVSPDSETSHLDSPPFDETEQIDPAKYFPAIAAAQAMAKERQEKIRKEMEMKRAASLASSSAASSFPMSAEARPGIVQKTNKSHKKSSSMIKCTHVVSPGRPFDEDGPEDELASDEERSKMEDPDDIEVDLFDQELRKSRSIKNVLSGTIGCKAVTEMEARKLMEAFTCGGDFTEFSGSAMASQKSCRLADAFYDSTCGTYRDANQMKRPFYDELFAQRFLKDITEDGFKLLWHLPPSEEESFDESANWSGRSVVMKIRPGSCYSTNDVEPKLMWTTLGAGRIHKKIARCLIPLLKIKSISTSTDGRCGTLGNEIKDEEVAGDSCGGNLNRMDGGDEDVCLFSITTEEGDVQIFEAASPRERDVLVTGLKNVIARLSFHVIVGDAGASSELYYEDESSPPPGELPSISCPIQNMNRIAHALLD